MLKDALDIKLASSMFKPKLFNVICLLLHTDPIEWVLFTESMFVFSVRRVQNIPQTMLVFGFAPAFDLAAIHMVFNINASWSSQLGLLNVQ